MSILLPVSNNRKCLKLIDACFEVYHSGLEKIYLDFNAYINKNKKKAHEKVHFLL